MNRTPLPERREGHTMKLNYVMAGGVELRVYATFGYDAEGRIREVFGSASKTGTDMRGLITDGCIAISLLLQHGMTIAEVADALGEARPEGMSSGPPDSPLGLIAREGAKLETSLAQVSA